MTLFSSLLVSFFPFFFFRVMARWFSRLPLPCAGVVGLFPKNLGRDFILTVTNNRIFALLVF